MKQFFTLLFLFSSFNQLNAQYYLRGSVRNEKNENLSNVQLYLHSDKNIYHSGSSGGFGVSSLKYTDSITFTSEGYEIKTVKVSAAEFTEVVLHPLSTNSNKSRPKLISITKDSKLGARNIWSISDESYFSLVENEIVNTSSFPNTGFSLNVNKASYSNVRRFLKMNSVAPPDAVRTEELLNYFNLNYSEPSAGEYFKIESDYATCPWSPKNRLLFMTINAKKIDLEKVPPSNLVFLIDASGSMDMPNRLPLVKAAFQMLVKNLRPIDTVSIVTYGGSVSVWLEPTGGDDKQKILKAIEELTASGDTPGENGIKTAYKVAEKAFIKGGNNRVILATDGDFNVGETTEKSLEDLVSKERQSGVFLTCLGVGTGNFKDSKLQSMAKRGNGNYAYLDDIKEAEKVLVTEMTQTFYSVAGDVFLNVTFNPAVVGEYRLIGFDNKKDAFTDSTGQLEGGEVGSGNSVLALFEITPTASAQIIGTNNYLAEVSLRYTPIEQKEEKLFQYKCPNTTIPFDSLKKDLRFATSIAMFGQKLRASKNIPATINWSDIKKIAINARDTNNFLEGDFIQLLDLSQKIYGNKRVKRRKSNDDN